MRTLYLLSEPSKAHLPDGGLRRPSLIEVRDLRYFLGCDLGHQASEPLMPLTYRGTRPEALWGL